MIKMRSIALKFSEYNRLRKTKFVLKMIVKYNIKNVLFVGVNANPQVDNFSSVIERRILASGVNVTASGIERDSTFWPRYVVADGRNLPFGDKEFDLVFSNAVIEHVGDSIDQQRFIQEHDRVGKIWILTTPNRLFPIEAHTYRWFRHMRKGWSHPQVSRLLSSHDLRDLIPASGKIQGRIYSPTLIAYSSPNELLQSSAYRQ